jgi:antitoxin ParD1/3/4
MQKYKKIIITPHLEKSHRNKSLSLGSYFDKFVEERILIGRYNNESEVIRAGLRLLEEEENKIIALREAILEGVDSGLAKNFNPEKHLKMLKSKRNG